MTDQKEVAICTAVSLMLAAVFRSANYAATKYAAELIPLYSSWLESTCWGAERLVRTPRLLLPDKSATPAASSFRVARAQLPLPAPVEAAPLRRGDKAGAYQLQSLPVDARCPAGPQQTTDKQPQY